MLLHLLRYEFKLLLASRVLPVLALLLAGLLFFSLRNGQERVARQQGQLAQLQTWQDSLYQAMHLRADSVEQGLLSIDRWWADPTNPLVASTFSGRGKYTWLAPEPLAAVAIGQSDVLPYYAKISLYETTTGNDLALENAVHLASGPFDLAFVLVWLLPLLVIAFSYNLLSAERELGTLRLLQAQPVALSQVLAGKVLFRYLFFVGISSLLLLGSLAALGLPVWLADTGWLLLALWLYAGFWFGLAYLINWLGHSSAVNALLLVGSWIVFVLVVPALAHLVAEQVHPVPSRVAWVHEKRDLEAAFEAEADSLEAAWVAAQPDTSWQADPIFVSWKDFFLTQPVLNRRLADARTRYDAAYARQQALSQGFRFASPAILMQQALERLAGTDAARLRQLDTLTQSGWQQWWDFFAGRYMARASLKAADYAAIPRLGPGNLAATPVGGALLGLGLMVGLVLGLGRWRAR